jgi:hypothetical protein
MIGSSKINETTNDLQRLQDLFDLGLNNSEISRIYRTNSGESLSRIHISSIRRGKRWNFDNHSFVMKRELNIQDTIETTIEDDVIKSMISPIITDTTIYYIYLTYINFTPTIDIKTSFIVEKPTRSDLIEYHMNLINKRYGTK